MVYKLYLDKAIFFYKAFRVKWKSKFQITMWSIDAIYEKFHAM